jgi:hypothetical protein
VCCCEQAVLLNMSSTQSEMQACIGTTACSKKPEHDSACTIACRCRSEPPVAIVIALSVLGSAGNMRDGTHPHIHAQPCTCPLHLCASQEARQGAWKVWAQGGRRCSRSPASNGSRHTAQLGGTRQKEEGRGAGHVRSAILRKGLHTETKSVARVVQSIDASGHNTSGCRALMHPVTTHQGK